MLEGIVLIAVLSAGRVRARIIGRAVWIEKYIGKVACCNCENCGRGRFLKATIPPTKL